MNGLGHGGASQSYAFGVSADGSVVVGGSKSGSGHYGTEAFIWTQSEGMRSLREMLMSDFGLDLSGWELSYATGISWDGLTIVGVGWGPSGYEGWRVTLPNPVPAPGAFLLGILGLGMAGMRLRRDV